MNDEQLRQPSDTPDLQPQDENTNGTGESIGEQRIGEGTIQGSIGNANVGAATETSSVQAAPGNAGAGGNGDGDITAGESAQPTLEGATEPGMASGALDAQNVDTSGMAPEPGLPTTDQPLQTDAVGAPVVGETAQSVPLAPEPPPPAGTTSVVQDPAVADALTPHHPSAPVGGTVQQAPADEVLADAGVTGAPVAPGTAVGTAAGTGGQTGEEEPEEAPVVRSARDSRLNEMAPNASMEDLLRASEQQYRTLKHGDVIEGTVMKVDRDEILVDIGAKSEGIIPSHELQSLSEEERQTLKPGDGLLVSVVQPENAEGHAILSLDRARQEKSWRDLQKQFEAGEIIQAPVSGYNKGGLLVNLAGVRGFVPSSQVSSISGVEANKQSEMARLQGQTLPLKIIEINRNRNRLILSERQAVQEQRESVRSRLLRELESGQVVEGRVSSICDFGAFVDVGGADGLIHLSELSWKRVSHPREVLSVGDRINVYVLSVDRNERKIALSLKRTQPEPWSTITENYHLGQVVRGTITQLTTFGAFARLEDGVEGLIHVSELAEGRVAHPSKVVNVGDVLDLKVIRIDPARRRIGLSLKRVHEDAEAGEQAAAGPVDAETAAEASAPSVAPEPGAYGVEDVTPRAQVTETTTKAPAAEVRAETTRRRAPQPEEQLREDEEPMGALAAALAAHTRQLAAAESAESAGEATEEEAAPEIEARVEAEVPVEAKAEPEGEAAVEAEAEVEATPEAEAETEVEAEAEEEPKALIPAATEVEASEAAAEEAAGEEAAADEETATEEPPAEEATTEEASAEEQGAGVGDTETASAEIAEEEATEEADEEEATREESSTTDEETGEESRPERANSGQA